LQRSELRPIIDCVDHTSPERYGDIFQWFSDTSPDLLGDNIEIPRSMQLFAQIRFNNVGQDNKPQYLVHQVDQQIKIARQNFSPGRYELCSA
jgi:hypothetical protein